MKVFVDGRPVGWVKGEHRLSVHVPAGVHSIHVGLDWQKSAPVDVDLGEDGSVTLRARVDLRATTWRSLFAGRGEAIDLDVV